MNRSFTILSLLSFSIFLGACSDSGLIQSDSIDDSVSVTHEGIRLGKGKSKKSKSAKNKSKKKKSIKNALHLSDSQFGEIQHADQLNIISGLTLSAWIYLEGYNEWASVATKGDAGSISPDNFDLGDGGFAFHQAGGDYFYNSGVSGRMRFTGIPTPPYVWDSDAGVPLNEWHHVAVTFDGRNLTFYMDGITNGSYVVSEDALEIGTTQRPLYIGADFPGGNEFWNGAIDEIEMWNVALNANQVKAAMHGSSVPYHRALVGYWDFNEDSGGQFEDRSGFEANGNVMQYTGIGPDFRDLLIDAVWVPGVH